MEGRFPDGRTAETIRNALRGKTGRRLWRSLDELARTPEFLAFADSEFPALRSAGMAVGRRTMLKAMAASLALAGLGGCDGEPDPTALPYVDPSDFSPSGNARWYATAVTPFGYAQPVLGKTYAGRPVKLEGNPDHPACQGASDAFTQAALLGLYDPERSQSPRYLGQPATWDAFDTATLALAADTVARHGAGFRLLTGASTSPTQLRQIGELLARWPEAQWHILEPVNEDARLEAAASALGRPLDHHLQLENCEVLVSLDNDVLGSGPRQVLHGLQWSKRRQARQAGDGECRLLMAEPTPSATGACADERLPASPQRMSALLAALGRALGLAGGDGLNLSAAEQDWITRCAHELDGHRGRSAVTIGAHYPAPLHSLALAINNRLGNVGATVRFTVPILASALVEAEPFDALVQDMMAGRVSTILTIDCNPAYVAAPDLEFGRALDRVKLTLHAGTHADETAALCHWHLPLHHGLEDWSDARAVDGTASIIQPLVQPLYRTRSRHEVLAHLLGDASDGRQIVQATWKKPWSDDFERQWAETLQRGFVLDSAAPFEQVSVAATPTVQPEDSPGGITALMRADPTIWDGRFFHNAWLQELPKPLTKITWGNAILVSPALATERRLKNGDELVIRHDGRELKGPVWIMPGQESRCVTLALGYGRDAGDDSGGLGHDVFAFRSSRSPWHAAGVKLEPTGETLLVASTQLHQAMDGFDFVRTVKLSASAGEKEAVPPSFYPVTPVNDPSWGMSIDLDLCIGCNACVVACVAENNIPMVGKELIAQGREMFWLRVDHYHEGDPANPKSYFQPVPCMHCEQAPCEMGCPVNATVHSADGLNLQVYNRCIGTRTCSSFCPYKVRHFNWFDYTGDDPESIRAMRNPDVTVRARGVMEKCTYCVQRISEARIAAQIAGREIRDGEVKTACQQACPAQAIVFGNIADPNTEVSRRKAGKRDYSLLEEANTRPRTTYLARIEDDETTPAGKS
jgi:molybdopterin-containing oxidoreductase family iron-sulfur binding subunit